MSLSPMNRRNAFKLLGLAAGASALAACAPSGSKSETSGDPLAENGVKNFNFTAWSLNEASTKDALTGLVDTYAGASGGKITTASYPYNDYLNQLLLQVRGGSLSGVVQLDVAWLATLAATGKLVDLGPLVAQGGYTDAAVGIGKAAGKQYGLPWTSAGIGLIGNSELLGRAGITAAPKTIDEFEQALRALKGLGGGVVPWAAMTKVDQLKDFIAWMWAFGSPVVENGKITVGDDASVEALIWYKKLYDEKLTAPDVNRFDARALFSQGKVGFYEDAIGGRGAVTKTAPDKELGSKLMPISRPVKASGDTPRHLAWGHALAVLQGEGSGAAAKFASTITSDPAYTAKWFKTAGLPPTTKAGLATSDVTSDAYIAAFTSTIGANTTPDPFWIYPKFAQIETALANAVQSALIGKAAPKEALATAKSQMDALTS
ncbi:multiple sugar transport system substrate-binding protein [Allocatelliglobosispora scoriae]|uniref:Multiple sugar transport system substrate-binding protein n=1 Tax=Allocatelliglobosispora scoriae TaxID=643052 RepID=A0A841C3K9_9ACTN|nr:extracellular solute-binding protein [Allocatelliglobosispora scoriae]MBB5874475.1 multiple sugar transport system substrate-binding protein [Allocatelliglobosispora scoriae]